MAIKRRISIVEKLAKTTFETAEFQARWNELLDVYGRDVESVFPDNYSGKVALAEAMEYMQEGNYSDAEIKIKAYLGLCESDFEKQILYRLIDICVSNIVPLEYYGGSDIYLRYREAILLKGFSEAVQNKGCFYREITKNVAFIINLYDNGDFVNIVYGFTVTEFAISDKERIYKFGSLDNECDLRCSISVSSKDDEKTAKKEIEDFYKRYASLSKNDILFLKRKKQRKFLSVFTEKLKPLEFKRLSFTKWSKELAEGYLLVFHAQESFCFDQYSFNVGVFSLGDRNNIQCYSASVVMDQKDTFNWQLMSEGEINRLFEIIQNKYLLPIINAPFEYISETDDETI